MDQEELKLLQGLGSTADEVATAMRQNGVRGLPNAVRNLNPVVRYVRNGLVVDLLVLDILTGNAIRVSVGNRQKEAPLPQPVVDFLAAFNRGEYPDLHLPQPTSS